jgi:hypothetical protein
MNTKLIAVSASLLMAVSISACSYHRSDDSASPYTVSAYTAEAPTAAPLTGLNSDPYNPNGTPVPQVPSIYSN